MCSPIRFTRPGACQIPSGSAPCQARNRPAARSATAVRLTARRAGRQAGSGPLQGELPGIRDHRGQPAFGAPAEFGVDPVGGGDEHRRVTRPARGELGRDVPAGHLAAGAEHLEVGEPGAAAQVVDPVLTGHARLQGEHVGPGQVGHVDVVADAGAVRGGVVVAEQSHPTPRPYPPFTVPLHCAAAQGHPQDAGDQVRLRVVPLAQPPPVRPGRGARHVEVAQAHRADLVHPGVLGQCRVHGQLGSTVGAGRPGRGVLLDGRALGLAVDRRGGGEHDPGDPGLPHRLQQRQRTAQVVAPVQRRLGHRLGDQ